MQHPEPEEKVIRPQREGMIPAHLLDYDLTGPGSQRRFHTPAPQDRREAEQESRLSSPISQAGASDQRELTEEWQQTLEAMEHTEGDHEDLHPDSTTGGWQINPENPTPTHQST